MMPLAESASRLCPATLLSAASLHGSLEECIVAVLLLDAVNAHQCSES